MLREATNLQVTIEQLLPGQDFPGGSVNSRNYGRKEITALASSIATFGLLQPLLVVQHPDHPGKYFVAAGNLRLEALRSLVKAKTLPAEFVVPVNVRADLDIKSALQASMEENVVRAALHPVEQFEVFAALRDRGMETAAIADQYGLKPKQVEGFLALGRLSPKIRKAWLEGEIKDDSAKVFTLGDHKRQDQVFASLKKKGPGWLQPYEIRKALVGDQRFIKKALDFVGEKTYEGAGGKITHDLFGDNHVVSNPALLTSLCESAANKRIEELKADGWKWVESLSPEIENRMWNFGRVKGAETGKVSADDKAKSGCVIGFDRNGEFVIHVGLLKSADRPEQSRAASSVAKAKKTREEGGGFSNAIAQRMSEWATFGACNALAEDPKLSIAAAIAGIVGAGPVKLSEQGLVRKQMERDKPLPILDFGKQLTTLVQRSQPELLKMFAAIVGRSLNFQVFRPDAKLLQTKDVGALCNEIDGATLNKALVQAFADNASDYFSSVNKTLCLEAITEALGADAAKPLASKPKKDVATFAVNHVPKTGWLPEMMRSAGYAGPKIKKPTIKETFAKGKKAAKTAKAQKLAQYGFRKKSTTKRSKKLARRKSR